MALLRQQEGRKPARAEQNLLRRGNNISHSHIVSSSGSSRNQNVCSVWLLFLYHFLTRRNKNGEKPKKKKNALPSGNYRVQALDYVDAAGKRHYRSFTAATKKEAQLLAEEWRLNKKKGVKEPADLTVLEAVERYLRTKEAVLSPSTMKAYTSIKLTHLTGNLGKTSIKNLDSTSVQIWVSDLTKKGCPQKPSETLIAYWLPLWICLPLICV